MDPITVLLSALSLASTTLKPVSDQVVRDGYQALKALIVGKYGAQHARLESTLSEYAEDPDTYEKPAKKVLAEAGVDRDPQVLHQATQLIETAERAGAGVAGGLVGQLNAQHGRVVVIGRDQTGTLHMGDTLASPHVEKPPGLLP